MITKKENCDHVWLNCFYSYTIDQCQKCWIYRAYDTQYKVQRLGWKQSIAMHRLDCEIKRIDKELEKKHER